MAGKNATSGGAWLEGVLWLALVLWLAETKMKNRMNGMSGCLIFMAIVGYYIRKTEIVRYTTQDNHYTDVYP